MWQTTPKNGVPHYIYISEKTAKYIEDEKMKQEIQKLGKKWHNKHNLFIQQRNDKKEINTKLNDGSRNGVALFLYPKN